MPRSGILFIVSGSSGVGKSTLCRHVLGATANLRLSISYTTRPTRPGEEHGRDYWFVSRDEFQDMIDRHAFLEWAEVYGNWYGTPKRELLELTDQGIDVMLDVDVQGARSVMSHTPDAVSVFLLPPSLEALKARLESRGTDDPDVVAARFQQAKNEMAHHTEYEYTIRNGTLEQATSEFIAIVTAERVRTARVDGHAVARHGLVASEQDCSSC